MTYRVWLLDQIEWMHRERRRVQVKRANRRYRSTEKGRAAGRRHNAEQAATMYKYYHRRENLAEYAAPSRACRARKKAYLDELFADRHEKRVYIS